MVWMWVEVLCRAVSSCSQHTAYVRSELAESGSERVRPWLHGGGASCDYEQEGC